MLSIQADVLQLLVTILASRRCYTRGRAAAIVELPILLQPALL